MENLEDLFRKYQTPLYAYILRMVGDPHEAEELTQEAFVRACTAALRFRGESSVRTWLFGIGRNVVSEALRRPRPELLATEPSDRLSADPTDTVFLQAALGKVQPSDREILILMDALGFSSPEMATLLEATPEAVRVRLHRARQRLRAVIELWSKEETPHE